MAYVGKAHSLNAEVRLRKWPAGRVSQLKLFLGHLEQAVGISLAAQVEQSPKRMFSEFVPKIVPQDITVESSYQEVRVFFEPPRGLKNLLFYELQLSATSGFYNFDQFQTPEVFYIWSQLAEGTTYYLRIRVVTKNGEVGPWSENKVVETPFAQSYGLYDGTERIRRISTANGNPWTTCWERDYTAIGGKAYYSVDYDVEVLRNWNDPTNEGNIEWSDVEFKWMELPPDESEFVQKGQVFFATTYSSSNAYSMSGFYSFKVTTDGYETPLDIPGTWTNPRRGTFVQKFSNLEPGDYTLRLQARMIPDHNSFANDFVPDGGTSFTYGQDANVSLKNFNIFESLVSDE
jgi:hypothetical protein